MKVFCLALLLVSINAQADLPPLQESASIIYEISGISASGKNTGINDQIASVQLLSLNNSNLPTQIKIIKFDGTEVVSPLSSYIGNRLGMYVYTFEHANIISGPTETCSAGFSPFAVDHNFIVKGKVIRSLCGPNIRPDPANPRIANLANQVDFAIESIADEVLGIP